MGLSRKLRHFSKYILTFIGFLILTIVLQNPKDTDDEKINSKETIVVLKNSTIKSRTTRKVTAIPDLFKAAIREKLEVQNVTKVLILSVCPRSGSSYISEILSSAPMTSFWSEPLRFLYEKPPKDVSKSRKFGLNNELIEFTF